MRTWPATIIALVAALAACKDRSEPVPAASTAEPAAAQTIHAADDTPSGRALGQLVALSAPRLDRNPACADYARDTSEFLAALSQELGALRPRAATGVTPADLTRLGESLARHAGTLDSIARSRALTSELARLHRELSAAVADLADALTTTYGASTQTPATRVENAVHNVATTLQALDTLCATP